MIVPSSVALVPMWSVAGPRKRSRQRRVAEPRSIVSSEAGKSEVLMATEARLERAVLA